MAQGVCLSGFSEATSPEVTVCYATAVSIHQAQNETLSARTPTWQSMLLASAKHVLTS
jgi:hypothetical protein